MKKTRIISLLMSVVMAFTAIFPTFITYTESHAVDSVINVAEHTPQEIKQYIDSHQFSTSVSNKFTSEPSTSYPYSAGSLDDETLQNALNSLNCMRYIAGLQEVSLNSEYNELAQYASLVDCVNNVLTHAPEQPEDMPADIFQLGATGAGSSNMCFSTIRNIAHTVIGYMNDSDSSNISRLGHRRWCLNPDMKKTGFGAVDRYSAMYVFDHGRAGATEKRVCWPAQNMPTEYFSSYVAWSISMGENLSKYDIKVNLTRKSDLKEWNFNENSADGDFYVDNSYYGQRGCIIFRPSNISYSSGDVFDVRIEGMDEPVEYTVNFFSLSEVMDESGAASLGDVNNDGFVDASDASVVLAEYSSLSTNKVSALNEMQKKTADVNFDEIIDSRDASTILEFYSYLSTSNDNISMEEWIFL